MKYINILHFAAIITLLTACNEESTSPMYDSNKYELFNATILDSNTRTVLDNNYNVVWQAGDEISIFGRTGYHNQYVLKSGENTASGTFEPKDYAGTNPELEANYAIYPYNKSYILTNDKTVSVDISSWANQTYIAGTFENGKAFMTGKSDNTNIPFKNAQSVARFKVSSKVPGSYSIKTISISSASKALNGPSVIDMKADAPILECATNNIENSHKTNTLTCTEKVVLGVGETYFYMLMPTGAYSDLTIKITGKEEMNNKDFKWSYTIPSTITFQRSKFFTFEKEFQAVDFSGSNEGTGNN